ncbi:ubiquinol-cytochrome c reductase complex subunit, putative, partial [Plasmodium ovale curtisi]
PESSAAKLYSYIFRKREQEAKFQLQEEEELLGYHPYDRRLYSGGTTGFGDLEPGLHFLVSIPNLYGAAIPHSKKK